MSGCAPCFMHLPCLSPMPTNAHCFQTPLYPNVHFLFPQIPPCNTTIIDCHILFLSSEYCFLHPWLEFKKELTESELENTWLKLGAALYVTYHIHLFIGANTRSDLSCITHSFWRQHIHQTQTHPCIILRTDTNPRTQPCRPKSSHQRIQPSHQSLTY